MMKHSLLLLAAATMSATSFAQDGFTVSLAEENPFKFSANESYVSIFLGQETRIQNGLSTIVDGEETVADNYLYIGVDDVNRHLWIWDGSSSFGSTPDLNSFGIPGEYMSFVVGSSGWSGLGYTVDKGFPVNLGYIDSNWSFHLSVKSTSKETFTFTLADDNGIEAKLVLGDAPNGDGVAAIGNFPRDGEWYNLDFPMSYLEDQFEFSLEGATHYQDHNSFVILAGGVEGTIVDYDAVFFYGPKVDFSAVKDVRNSAAKSSAIYDLAGRRVDNPRSGVFIQNGKKVLK